MNFTIIPSPFHSLLCSYLLLGLFAAPFAVFGPTASGASTGTATFFPDWIDGPPAASLAEEPAVANTQNEPPACDAALSLAGREFPIDAATMPHMGSLQFPEGPQLHDKEVLLTFDDGPHPQRTYEILDILDRYCVKAVFFAVGEMALEHSEALREVARRGHVIGTHSFSHPLSLARLGERRAKAEIDMGFAAVSYALGGSVAPLFRFPGFNQAGYLLDYLSEKKVSVWSVDVVGGDAEFVGAADLPRVLFRRLHAQNRGVILLHDIKKATAERLTDILQQMKDEGFTVARPSMPASFAPDPALMAMFEAGQRRGGRALVHQVAQKFYTGPVSVRSSGRLRRARPVLPEFQEQ